MLEILIKQHPLDLKHHEETVKELFAKLISKLEK